MNRQEMFNFVATHLLTQKCRSKEFENGTCMYRGPGGLKCAVGALIPDAIYDRAFEGESAVSLIERFPEVKQYIPDVDLAQDLQYIHDDVPTEQWLTALKELAYVQDLNDAVLVQFE
jgi:hypothetical protein